MSKTIKLKANVNIKTSKGIVRKDKVVELISDGSGLPIDIFWRRRLEDSKKDNCVEVISAVKSKFKSKE